MVRINTHARIEVLHLKKARCEQPCGPGSDNGEEAVAAGQALPAAGQEIPVRKSKSQPRSAASTWSWYSLA
jgi:hypothetical protein